jgi:hypothetical protein
VYYHAPFGRGSQLNREEANVDYRERLKNLWREAYFARQSGDTETAAFLLRVYNDRRKQGPGDGRIKPLVFADLSTLPTTSSERREKQQTKADAVEAARAGRTDEARDLLAEYNEGRGRKFAYSGLLEAARRSE